MDMIQHYVNNALDTNNYPYEVALARFFINEEDEAISTWLHKLCENRRIPSINLRHIEQCLKSIEYQLCDIDDLVPRIAIEMTSQNVQGVSRNQGIYAHVVFLQRVEHRCEFKWVIYGYVRGRFNQYSLAATRENPLGLYGELMISGDSQCLTVALSPDLTEFQKQIAAIMGRIKHQPSLSSGRIAVTLDLQAT